MTYITANENEGHQGEASEHKVPKPKVRICGDEGVAHVPFGPVVWTGTVRAPVKLSPCSHCGHANNQAAQRRIDPVEVERPNLPMCDRRRKVSHLVADGGMPVGAPCQETDLQDRKKVPHVRFSISSAL